MKSPIFQDIFNMKIFEISKLEIKYLSNSQKAIREFINILNVSLANEINQNISKRIYVRKIKNNPKRI